MDINKKWFRRDNVASSKNPNYQNLGVYLNVTMMDIFNCIYFIDYKSQNSERNLKIFFDLIGYFDGKDKTLKEMAIKYSLSIERIRQIYEKFIWKINKFKRLYDFLEK